MTDLWAWLDGLGYRRELALWVGLSILLHTLGALLAWRFRHPLRGRLAMGLSRLRGHWGGPLLLESIRLAYFLLLPYAILIRRGVLELQTLGLLGPADPGQSLLGWGGEWVVAAGRMMALGLAGALVLSWGWRNYASQVPGAGFQVAGLGPILRETAYLQVHWAFYRAAPLLWFGPTGEGWPVFIGVVLVGLEAGLDPRLWAALREPARAPRPLLKAALCWLSALGFALTHNLWLVAAVHAGLTWGSARWLGRLSKDEAQDDQGAEDEPGQHSDALEVADDVLVLFAEVHHAGSDVRRP